MDNNIGSVAIAMRVPTPTLIPTPILLPELDEMLLGAEVIAVEKTLKPDEAVFCEAVDGFVEDFGRSIEFERVALEDARGVS